MDTTGCPGGFATDIAFQPRTATEPCTVPLAAFWSVLLFVVAVRFAAAVRQAVSWRNLNIKMERKNRKPVAVSLTFALVLFQFAGVFCIGFNVVNVYNGLSWMLYSLIMLPYFIETTFVMLRFVGLGERIIPLGRQMGLQSEDSERRSLRRFSKGGRFLIFWQFASAVVSSVTLMILSPANPSHQDLHGTIGLAFKAQFQFTAALGAIYQLHREALAKTKTSIRKMRERMLLAFVLAWPTSISYILTAFYVLPRNIWWIFLYPSASEAFFAAILEFVLIPQRLPARHAAKKEGGAAAPMALTSSGGNKVEPGMASQPSSGHVGAAQVGFPSAVDDEGSKSAGGLPVPGN